MKTNPCVICEDLEDKATAFGMTYTGTAKEFICDIWPKMTKHACYRRSQWYE